MAAHSKIDPAFQKSVCSRLRKSKTKSPDRMPARTAANITDLENRVRCWNSPHRAPAIQFMERIGPGTLHDILHSMRRWYSGQTMAHNLAAHRSALGQVMDLTPAAVKGIYRGFKVSDGDSLARVKEGDELNLPVKLNGGVSSWSTKAELTNRFSGAGPGRVGLIVKLVDGKGTTPVLAPPAKTAPWFNALYAEIIGTSFRPKEAEYLLKAGKVRVKVVRVKR